MVRTKCALQTSNLVLTTTHLRRPGNIENYWIWVHSTYLLTPWSTVLLEKLTGPQLLKKFPTFYGSRRFITAFTCVHHLSLSSARSIKPILPSHLKIHLNIILPTMPGSHRWSLTLRFPHQNPVYTSPPPYLLHAPPISFFWIWSPQQCCVSSTDHEAPHYVVLLLREIDMYCAEGSLGRELDVTWIPVSFHENRESSSRLECWVHSNQQPAQRHLAASI